MAYTQDDLIREVVAELFSLASGQPANAEDAARVQMRIPGAIAEMAGLNIIYIADGDSVPDAAFNATVTYIAEILGPNFGKPTDEAKKAAAEARLRTLQRIGKGTGQNLKTDSMLRAGARRWGYRIL